jgi:hypothetical protein
VLIEKDIPAHAREESLANLQAAGSAPVRILIINIFPFINLMRKLRASDY